MSITVTAPTGVASAAVDPDPLPRVRAWYYEAVKSERAIDPAMDSIGRLRESPLVAGRQELDLLLTAYEGALVTLRAKHGFWPTSRLRHLREGLVVLDAAVAAAPDQAEIRYLRLMSCFYLPGILGRGDSVREDFAALARLLPQARDRYDPTLWEAITTFVLENARLSAAQRADLQAGMNRAPS